MTVMRKGCDREGTRLGCDPGPAGGAGGPSHGDQRSGIGQGQAGGLRRSRWRLVGKRGC